LGFDFAEVHIANWIGSREKEILDCANSLSLGLVGHLPDDDLCDPNRGRNKELLEMYSNGIDAFHGLGIRKVVVHAYVGRKVDISKYSHREMKNLKLQRLKELVDVCEDCNIRLCVENTDENPEDMTIYFEELPSLFLCLDVGHANLFAKENKSSKFLERFALKLGHVHLCDNFGGYSESCDLHLPLGAGKIDFESILKRLKRIGYDDTITLEIVSRYRDKYLKVSLEILQTALAAF